jgi:hypothetical protein
MIIVYLIKLGFSYILVLDTLSLKRVLKDLGTGPLFRKYVGLPVTSWFHHFLSLENFDHGVWLMIPPENIKKNQPTMASRNW